MSSSSAEANRLPTPVLADIARQVLAVENHLVSKFPYFREDITQEAWVAALASAKYYRPDHPGAGGFFYGVATKWVAENVNRWLAKTSLTRAQARAGVGASQREASLDRLGCCQGVEEELEAAEARGQTLRALAQARVRWRRAVERALADLPAEDARVGALVYGLDGPPRSAGWVALDTGLWRDDVVAASDRFRAALRKHPGVANLERQIQQLEGELP